MLQHGQQVVQQHHLDAGCLVPIREHVADDGFLRFVHRKAVAPDSSACAFDGDEAVIFTVTRSLDGTT